MRGLKNKNTSGWWILGNRDVEKAGKMEKKHREKR